MDARRLLFAHDPARSEILIRFVECAVELGTFVVAHLVRLVSHEHEERRSLLGL